MLAKTFTWRLFWALCSLFLLVHAELEDLVFGSGLDVVDLPLVFLRVDHDGDEAGGGFHHDRVALRP